MFFILYKCFILIHISTAGCDSILNAISDELLFEPVHEISNNFVCASSKSLRSACAYAQSDQSLCLSLEYSRSVRLPTEHHLEFLSL